MASYASAAGQLTAEGSITTVVAALAILIAAFESDDVWETKVVLLPNGQFQGIVFNAVLP